MTTIRERISEGYITAHTQRLAQLEKMSAPAVMISAEREKVRQAESGNVPVRRLEEFGELTIESWTTKTGRMGHKYAEIMTGAGLIFYFPNGRFGPFLKRAEEPDR